MKKKNSCTSTDFCKKLEGDLGFPYIEAFCRALELYLDSLEAFNQKIFEYRGVYSRYAIERYLYFAFMNNTRLYSFFNEWKNGKMPSFNKARSGIERNLALCLCGKKVTSQDIAIKFKQRVNLNSLFVCGRLLAWRWSYYLGRFFTATRPQNNNRADVLIYIPSKKFIPYLSAITRILPFSFSYFIDNSNSKMVNFFRKKSLPFIDSRKLNISLGDKQKKCLPKELVAFRGLAFWYDWLYESVKILRPSCVIVVEGNAPGDELMNQTCKQLSIPIICLQQGWASIIHNGFRNMSFTKMLTWGEGFSELLQPYNPKQNLVAVGNHIIGQESVGMSEDTSFVSKAISFFLQVPTRLINEECWNEFFKLIVWTAVEFKHVPILVREFPVGPLSKQLKKELNKYPNINMRSSWQYPLGEVLKESQLAISICSSTIIESIAVGVLPIIFNMTSMPKIFPDIEAICAGLEVKTPQAARDAINRCLTDRNYREQFDSGMKLFQEKYFYKNDGKAVNRIAQEIASVIRT